MRAIQQVLKCMSTGPCFEQDWEQRIQEVNKFHFVLLHEFAQHYYVLIEAPQSEVALMSRQVILFFYSKKQFSLAEVYVEIGKSIKNLTQQYLQNWCLGKYYVADWREIPIAIISFELMDEIGVYMEATIAEANAHD